MSDNNQKENKENLLTKFLKAIHEYYIFSFVFLFGLSIIIFVFLYFGHSKKIENRFDNTLKNYEKSMSDIFNNIITNGSNENIYTNSLQTNNNQLQNDSIDKLKLSFEVGFKMLESSMNEIMKNSNDILQFWFAFLSIIMIVFNLAGALINNNILIQAKKQLEMVEKEAIISSENIEKETKKLIEENNRSIQEYNLFNLSTQAYYNKDYKLAIYYTTEAIKLNEKNSALYNNRGFAKYNLANSEIENKDKYNKLIKETIKDYNKAIKLNPNYPTAYNNRGISKAKLNMYKEAIKDFNKAIKLNPNFSVAYNNRGIAKYDLAKTKEKNSEEYNQLMKEAMHDYNKAIELNPNLSEAYYNRGNAKRKLQKIEEAIEDYNKAIELNTNFERAYFNRGISKCDLAISKKEVNKEEYNKLVNEAYNDFETAYNLADNELKKEIKRQFISLAQKENNEVAIKFCGENDIDYKN